MLEQVLYTDWFAQAGRDGTPGTDDPGAMPTLVAQLRAVHAATLRLEPGWQALGHGGDGLVQAVRAGQYIELAPPDLVNLSHPGAPVQPGDWLAATTRRDAVNSAGWWVTCAAVGPAPERDMMRVYWNCPAPTAVPLVGALTTTLERLAVAYTLKCPSISSLFDRVDSLVLYLGRDTWPAVNSLLRDVHASFNQRLRPTVPPLTLRLGRGAAAAQDPGDGQSFGQSRVRAVVDGLLSAADRRVVDVGGVTDVIGERLRAHGIDPARPYQDLDTTAGGLAPW
jgi:hypothetical protein